MIALRVTFNLLLRLKQTYREDRNLGPTLQKIEDIPAVYCPEPFYQRVYSHNQLDKIICTNSRGELESVVLEADSDRPNQDEHGHFQFLENQIFRKTYVAAKKEIDEWLRAHSYVRSKTPA